MSEEPLWRKSSPQLRRYGHTLTHHYRTYTAALSCGVSGGIIISGFITITHSWRYIYYVATALIGGVTLLVFFTMPETSFNRSPANVPTDPHATSKGYAPGESALEASEKGSINEPHPKARANLEAGKTIHPPHQKRSYIQSLKVFNGILTQESIFRLLFRPVALLVLPPVLWATLVMSVTIGFLVAISSNFAPALSTAYKFEAWQSGLCFVSGLIGALLGILGGGYASDVTANFFTARNGGIREPEMRLPAVTIGLIASPLGLVLYGVGINNQLHWMVPTLGLGFRKSPSPPRAGVQLTRHSQLLHRASNKCHPRLHHRRLPPRGR